MPVGIENLATGFLQGLNARKQQERQDVIDQREAERFDMQKQQFADNQAANQLAMKTNQFQLAQAQKTADRGDITWNQQQDEIKRKKDFESDLRTIFALEKEGNTEGLAKFLTEKNKTLGIKGDFERDYVTGKGALKLDKDGKAVFVHEDGTRTVYDMDDYGADFVAKFDPVTAIRNKQKTAEEIAKEDRKFKRELKLSGIKHSQALQLEGLRSRNQRALLEERGKLKDPKKYLSKPTQDSFYDVQEIIDPFTKKKSYSKPIFNQDRYDDFMLFSHANNLDPDDNAYRLWRKNRQAMPNGLTINQPIQTREGLITPTNLDGGDIDMSDFSLTPSGVGGNMQNSPIVAKTPQSMPVPQVVPTASYRVPTNKGYVLYDENGNAVNYVNPTPTMPIDVVNAVRDAIPDMPPPRQFPPGTTYFNPPRRMPAGQNFFSGSNPFEDK